MSKAIYLFSAVVLSLTLSACGKPDAPAADSKPAPSVAPAATAAADAQAAPDNALGKSTFGKVCSMCHAAGVAGAPKPGDHGDWGPRIAQGKEVLYKHALEGFNGAKGSMPARGGSTTLKDEEVKAAVDYMVSLSQ